MTKPTPMRSLGPDGQAEYASAIDWADLQRRWSEFMADHVRKGAKADAQGLYTHSGLEGSITQQQFSLWLRIEGFERRRFSGAGVYYAGLDVMGNAYQDAKTADDEEAERGQADREFEAEEAAWKRHLLTNPECAHGEARYSMDQIMEYVKSPTGAIPKAGRASLDEDHCQFVGTIRGMDGVVANVAARQQAWRDDIATLNVRQK